MRTPARAAMPAVALVTLAGAVALPAITSDAQTSGPREITVREKLRAIEFVHHKRSTRRDRLDMGDRVLTQQALFNESDARVGTLFTDCVNVGHKAAVFRAVLQCTATYRFRDGQVVASGVVRLSDRRAAAPIVGGRGAYRGASGEVRAGAPVRGYDSVDVLQLDG